MANKYKRIYVYPSDIKILSGKSESAAYREYHEIKSFLAVMALTIYHLRDYYPLALEDIVDALGLNN